MTYVFILLSDISLIESFLVLGMSSFMLSNDSEGRSGWGSGEQVPADSLLESFPFIATQVAIIIIVFLGTHPLCYRNNESYSLSSPQY